MKAEVRGQKAEDSKKKENQMLNSTKLIITGLILLQAAGFTPYASAETELPSRRSYNTKVYDLGNGKMRYKCHVGHIHYKDEEDNFYKIDTTLVKNDTGWAQSKASYHCQIPEYADGIFEFVDVFEGEKQTIKTRPIARHIKGELLTESKDWQNKQVLYRDAFAEGIDLRVTAAKFGLKKEVIIYNRPEPLKDLHFDFELLLGEETRIHADEIDISSVIGEVDVTGKIVTFGKGDNLTYLRRALVWDETGKTQPVQLSLYKDNGKLILRKTVTEEFIQTATFPVYTDDSASYDVGSGDGQILGWSATWNDVHNAAEGNQVYSGSNNAGSAAYNAYGTYYIGRSFFPIDTSSLADGATITDATFNFSVEFVSYFFHNGTRDVALVQTSQASCLHADCSDVPLGANCCATLVEDDFDECGAIDVSPIEGASRITITAFGAASFSLNATGRIWISDIGYTKLGIRSGSLDCDNIPPTAYSEDTVVSINTSEDAGNEPYLDVTVQAAASAPPVQIRRGVTLRRNVTIRAE